MSIATEISRLQTAKAGLKTVIEAKGVTVPAGAMLGDYPALVGDIQQGSQLNVQPRKQITISANTTLVPLSILPDSGYDVMQEVEATVNVPSIQSGTFTPASTYMSTTDPYALVVRGILSNFVLLEIAAAPTDMHCTRVRVHTTEGTFSVRGGASGVAVAVGIDGITFANGSISIAVDSNNRLNEGSTYAWYAW